MQKYPSRYTSRREPIQDSQYMQACKENKIKTVTTRQLHEKVVLLQCELLASVHSMVVLSQCWLLASIQPVLTASATHLLTSLITNLNNLASVINPNQARGKIESAITIIENAYNVINKRCKSRPNVHFYLLLCLDRCFFVRDSHLLLHLYFVRVPREVLTFVLQITR